jgi:hypothetical protein
MLMIWKGPDSGLELGQTADEFWRSEAQQMIETEEEQRRSHSTLSSQTILITLSLVMTTAILSMTQDLAQDLNMDTMVVEVLVEEKYS